MTGTETVELFCPAKLNLALHVYGRRPDGYHEIDTLMQAIDFGDRIWIDRAEGIHLEVTGPRAGQAPGGPENLVWRAAEALGVGGRIRLHKEVPAGAGLGGGSSDAAATLLGLNRVWGLGRSREELAELAGGLGSDVPFFLWGGLARCRGRGERVEPLETSPNQRFLLVLPPIHLSAGAVYGAFDPNEPPLTPNGPIGTVFAEGNSGPTWPPYALFVNRLQAAAERLEPEVRRLRMVAEREFGGPFVLTGSGAALFRPLGPEEADPADLGLRDWGTARVDVRLVRAMGAG